ncbi:MAG TPA: hypothetical protein VK658_06210, partial [Chryseolinea sp.]|nr:hypothetical protein [Chryseolinea sp.]
MKQSAVLFIFQDWKANSKNPKGRIFVLLFRIANLCSRSRVYFYLGVPYLFFYKAIVQTIFALEVPWNISAGRGLVIYHCVGLIINKGVTIGSNCVLRHCT